MLDSDTPVLQGATLEAKNTNRTHRPQDCFAGMPSGWDRTSFETGIHLSGCCRGPWTKPSSASTWLTSPRLEAENETLLRFPFFESKVLFLLLLYFLCISMHFLLYAFLPLFSTRRGAVGTGMHSLAYVSGVQRCSIPIQAAGVGQQMVFAKI